MSRNLIFVSPERLEVLAWQNPGTPVEFDPRGFSVLLLNRTQYVALDSASVVGGVS